MIRIIVDRASVPGKNYQELVGLASDTKPVEGLITGSKFTEIDTAAEYLFSEDVGEWLIQGTGRTSIVGATVTLGASPAYDGTEKTQTVSSVVLGETTLTASTDYKVVNNKGTLPGTYTLHIVGVGSYCGVIAKSFTVTKGSGSVVASPDTFTLTEGGDAGTSTLTVTGDGAISVSTSAKAVATAEVDGTTVTITPVAEGSATVTVTLAAGDLYTGGTDTISVTVSAE
jgi:hypothetical protein